MTNKAINYIDFINTLCVSALLSSKIRIYCRFSIHKLICTVQYSTRMPRSAVSPTSSSSSSDGGERGFGKLKIQKSLTGGR